MIKDYIKELEEMKITDDEIKSYFKHFKDSRCVDCPNCSFIYQKVKEDITFKIKCSNFNMWLSKHLGVDPDGNYGWQHGMLYDAPIKKCCVCKTEE